MAGPLRLAFARRPRGGSGSRSRAGLLAWARDRTCSCTAPCSGRTSGACQGELLQQLATDLFPRPQRQLDEGGAGQQDGAGDGVVGQPGVGLQGDAAGQGETARPRDPRSPAPSSGCSAATWPARADVAGDAGAGGRASSACAGRDRSAAARALAPVPSKKAAQSTSTPAAWAWARERAKRSGPPSSRRRVPSTVAASSGSRAVVDRFLQRRSPAPGGGRPR